jgi:hypothetical protein
LFLGGWHAPVRVLEIVPSYVWFFAKLSALLFVYIWLRGNAPAHARGSNDECRLEVHVADGFTCVIAAAVWHYAGRGMRGWLWSLFVIVFVYSALSILLDTRRKFARRRLPFRRMNGAAFILISRLQRSRGAGGRDVAKSHARRVLLGSGVARASHPSFSCWAQNS